MNFKDVPEEGCGGRYLLRRHDKGFGFGRVPEASNVSTRGAKRSYPQERYASPLTSVAHFR